jgi:hypothetical protein
MAPRHTSTMEAGNAIFACQYMDVRVRAHGAIAESKKWPYFLYIYAPCHPWHRAIRPPWMAEMSFLHASTWMYVLGQCMEQLPRAKNGRTSCTYTLHAIPGTALYDRHGWRKCHFCMEQKMAVLPVHIRSLPIPGTALYRTSCT